MNNKITNIYIAGCGGMLGDAFYKIYSNNFNIKCSDKIVNEKWLTQLDFTEYENYFEEVKKNKSDLLIHLGAMTNLEECETNPTKTYLNNTKAVEYAVKISNEMRIPLMFISTAGIFDGKKSFYNEWFLTGDLGLMDEENFIFVRGRIKELIIKKYLLNITIFFMLKIKKKLREHRNINQAF